MEKEKVLSHIEKMKDINNWKKEDYGIYRYFLDDNTHFEMQLVYEGFETEEPYYRIFYIYWSEESASRSPIHSISGFFNLRESINMAIGYIKVHID